MRASTIPFIPTQQSLHRRYSLAAVLLMLTLMTAVGAQAAPADAVASQPDTSIAADGQIDTTLTSTALTPTLAMQRQPAPSALSTANQKLVTENVSLQRQVDDLQTQVNVLIYESKGQLFVYGAMTALLSLALGVFISWLIFRRRSRW